MIKEMEKALKRYLKGKNRITMGVVVAFLLGSSFAFGDVTVKYEGSTIKILDKSGNVTEIGTVTKNSANEFTWTLPEGVGINETVKIDDSINTNNIKVNIVNSRNINSSGTTANSGNGIYSFLDSGTSTIGNIINSGTISGKSTSGNNSGNGIHSFYEAGTSIIGNIINSGTISGESTGGDDSGNGIFSYSPYYASTIGNILNHGNINGTTTGNGNNSGNAIYSYSEGETSIIGNITNGGIISGNGADGDNSGNGIYSYSDSDNSTIGAITNSGTISGKSTGGNNSGNGIFANSEDTSSSSTATSNSIIGNIINSGIISGEGTGSESHSGNGIYSYSQYGAGASTIRNITNSGTINGNSNNGDYSGNGIFVYSDDSNTTIGDIINYGIISGKSNGGYNSGNGIFVCSVGSNTIGNIINKGYIINGIRSESDSDFNKIGSIINKGNIINEIYFYSAVEIVTIESISNTGIMASPSSAGIYLNSPEQAIIKLLSNSGVIMGKENAISNESNASDSGIANYNNYGLVIGKIPVDIANGIQIYNPEGQGMAITIEEKVDKNGSTYFPIKSIARGNGTGVSTEGYSIINAGLKNSEKDAYDNFEGTQEKKIINGAGVASGTVTIEADKNFSLNGGIINAYKTAVTVKDGASFTGIDVTINGGGLDGNTAVISGDSGANTVNISGNSFINGDIDLDTGDDILNFGSAVSRTVGNDNINLFHKISNVENININQKVTAFETSEIKGADKINIGKNGELVLRIDGANSNKHALSNGNGSGTIDSEGGKLLLALNGVSDGSTIDMGIKLGDGIYGVENPDIKYRDLFTLETTSYLHSLRKTGEKEVTVETKSTLPLSYTNYYRLNKIYQSMRAVDGVKEFNVDTDEKFSSFIGYLNDIYAGNPYSYSSELSRKSMGMFRDIVTENSFKADTGKWMIYGGLTHIDGGTKDTYYGKGYYTYDIGSSDIDSDTKITGAYMLGEYGVSDDFKAGVAVGGNKLKSDLSNGSKVDGDALYIGGYAKKYLGNLKVTAGAGFQYGDYDADRIAAGREITETRSYSSSYNDMTYDIYLNGRYSHNIGDNLYLEPYGTLSYTYVDQDGADEGNKTLAIETDSKSFDYTSAKVGLDLKKVIPHEKGKSTLSVGASYTRLLNGADEEYITGRFKGGSDFDILVAHKNEHSLGLNAKYALELENGILFDVKGSYAVERDSHNQSGKNKTKGEWIVGAGLGYKF
ncbi:autotransporter [Fusobacterium varium]|nr:autotransporter [Fusobacterium varium]